MACTLIDYKTKSQERLASQFIGKPNLKAFIDAFIDDDLDQAMCDVTTQRGLNTAVGVQLDGIGEIVGLPRPKQVASDSGNFGFAEDDDARGFGTLLDPTPGGFWSQLNPPVTVPVNDDIYRIQIKGQIFKNSTNMTVDETLDILSIVFNNAPIKYFLPVNLFPMYEIGLILNSFEEGLLANFPQTIGIGEVQFKLTNGDEAFGFAEDIKSKGFGSTTDSTVGGNYSKFI